VITSDSIGTKIKKKLFLEDHLVKWGRLRMSNESVQGIGGVTHHQPHQPTPPPSHGGQSHPRESPPREPNSKNMSLFPRPTIRSRGTGS